MNNEITITDRTQAKKSYLLTSAALIVYTAIAFSIALIFRFIFAQADAAGAVWHKAAHWNWILTILENYVIAIPVFFLIIRRLPKDNRAGEKAGPKFFFTCLVSCVPLMYLGSILGNTLSSVIAGGKAHNVLLDYVSDPGILKIIVTVIMAPLLEELVFRKLIIDHTSSYNETAAVLFSALAFGLFHHNLYQFFYAFLIGLVFGYVYLRTKNVLYSALMHMSINFVGAVISPLLLKLTDVGQLFPDAEMGEEAEYLMSHPEVIPKLYGFFSNIIIVFLFSCTMIGLAVAGTVILIKNAKKIRFCRGENEIGMKAACKAAYLNIAFAVFLIVSIILSLRSIGLFS